jgi:hypothetical protein
MNGTEEFCSAVSIYVLMFALVCDEYEIFNPRRKIGYSEIDCWSVTQNLLFGSAWHWNVQRVDTHVVTTLRECGQWVLCYFCSRR